MEIKQSGVDMMILGGFGIFVSAYILGWMVMEWRRMRRD